MVAAVRSRRKIAQSPIVHIAIRSLLHRLITTMRVLVILSLEGATRAETNPEGLAASPLTSTAMALGALEADRRRARLA